MRGAAVDPGGIGDEVKDMLKAEISGERDL
jgi:hypothetical protein